MNMPAINKVCAPVGDQPAITRLVSTLRESGFDIIVIVVGHNAESVMELVSKDFPGVIFAYQPEQHGTGVKTAFAGSLFKAIQPGTRNFRGKIFTRSWISIIARGSFKFEFELKFK